MAGIGGGKPKQKRPPPPTAPNPEARTKTPRVSAPLVWDTDKHSKASSKSMCNEINKLTFWVSFFKNFPDESLNLKGLTISDPEGGEFHPGSLNFGEELNENGSADEPNRSGFRFTENDRDREMAQLLKEFYSGE